MHKSKNNFSEITKCRLCGSKKLKKFIDFGCAPLGNNLQETKELSLNAESYSLKVMRCNDCQHFQLSVSVSPELLYATNYTYLSGIGPSFVDHIKKYVVWILKKTFLFALENQSVLLLSDVNWQCVLVITYVHIGSVSHKHAIKPNH